MHVGEENSFDWRRLNTNQLVSKLRSTFGNYYHPRTKARPLPSYWNHNTYRSDKISRKQLRTCQKPIAKLSTHASKSQIMEYPGPTSALFPWPMQAPQPWASPSYYVGQIPPLNPMPVQTLPMTTQHQWNNHQPATLFQPQQGNLMMQQPVNVQQANQNFIGAASPFPANYGDGRGVQASGCRGA